jgi:hypothetical protein
MPTELFDAAAGFIEARSGLDRLESRGTLRITLKNAGLDPNKVTPAELRVVFEKRMPGELEKLGVADAETIAQAVWSEIARCPEAENAGSDGNVDGTFRRLGGD